MFYDLDLTLGKYLTIEYLSITKGEVSLEEILTKNSFIIISAIIAGFFSYTSLIVSKENKVSEFRQEWINSLRNSISSYVSSLCYISMLYKHRSGQIEEKKDKFNMTRDIEDIYSKMNESYNDIIFRINDKEVNTNGNEINSKFLSELKRTRQLYLTGKWDSVIESCDDLREASKPLLKHEWNRVKEGEPNYQKAKKYSLIVLCIAFLAVVTSTAYSILDPDNEKLDSQSKTFTSE